MYHSVIQFLPFHVSPCFSSYARVEKKLSRTTEFKFFAKMVSLLGFSVNPVTPSSMANTEEGMECDRDETGGDFEEEEEAVRHEKVDCKDKNVDDENETEVWEDSIAHLKAVCQSLCHMREDDDSLVSNEKSSSFTAGQLDATHECLMVVLQRDVYLVR